MIAHAAHYMIESLGLEMANMLKLAAQARAGESEQWVAWSRRAAQLGAVQLGAVP